MNCERSNNEWEDFLYGELSAARAAERRAHLVACAACAGLHARLEREQELFAAYHEQTALEPAAEMWEAIRSRIGAEVQTRPPVADKVGWARGMFVWLLSPAVLQQAAFAAALIVVSVAATALYFSTRKESRDVAGVNPTPTPPAAPTVTPSPAVHNATNIERAPAPKPVVVRVVNRPAPPPTQLSEQDV